MYSVFVTETEYSLLHTLPLYSTEDSRWEIGKSVILLFPIAANTTTRVTYGIGYKIYFSSWFWISSGFGVPEIQLWINTLKTYEQQEPILRNIFQFSKFSEISFHI